jgi:hypothetical protein
MIALGLNWGNDPGYNAGNTPAAARVFPSPRPTVIKDENTPLASRTPLRRAGTRALPVNRDFCIEDFANCVPSPALTLQVTDHMKIFSASELSSFVHPES